MAHPGKHLISLRNFPEASAHALFATAAEYRAADREISAKRLHGAHVGLMFFQPSTRTRIGYEVAAVRLGATPVGFADVSVTRSVDYTAETLEDAVQVMGYMTDVLVMRHFITGSAQRASAISPVPLISGGDGSNEHPSQALGDLWLMSERLGGISGATLGLVGDPGTRVFRSLIHGFTGLGGAKIMFLLPPGPLQFDSAPGIQAIHATLPEDIRRTLTDSGIEYEFCHDIRELLTECDAIEMMPVVVPDLQQPPGTLRAEQYTTPERYRMTAAKVAATNSRALLLHPGPRTDELDPDTDELPTSLYFREVEDLVFMRMAVLAAALP